MLYNTINVTGIRDNEYITSSDKATQNKGTILQVKGFYPPSSYFKTFDNYDIFVRDTLREYDFFKDKTYEERINWLNEYYTNNPDLYLEDVPNLQIKFIKISGSFMTSSFTEENIQYLLQDKYFDIKEIYNMIPKKPGSRAKKHTLIFRPSNWKLFQIKKEEKIFTGFIIENNNFYEVTNKTYDNIFIINNIGIIFDSNNKITKDIAYNILTEKYGNEVNEVNNIINFFTPALYKSLIQKIIRTSCDKISDYNSEIVLSVAFTNLLFHPDHAYFY